MKKPMLCCIAGGVIGALIWTVIGLLAEDFLGWVAVLVGLLAGVGARLGAGEGGNREIAKQACIVAALSILVGRFLVVSALVSTVDNYSEEDVISFMAYEVVYEMKQRGETINWPDPDTAEFPLRRDDFPVDVWSEADRRWHALTLNEQKSLLAHPRFANPDRVYSYVACDIAGEREDAGQEIPWPGGDDQGEFWHEADFPPEIWQEAIKRWETWSESRRQDYLNNIVAYESQMEEQVKQAMTIASFLVSFGLLDLIWSTLSIVAAYMSAVTNLIGDKSE